MISSNSRYANDTVTTVNVNGSPRQVIVLDPPATTTINYVSHIFTSADTIDGLAYTFYGDATQWWQIADANPEIIAWDTLAGGTTIRIPTL